MSGPVADAAARFGRAIATWRADNGLTLRRAAQRLHVTSETLIVIEQGRIDPAVRLGPAAAVYWLRETGLTADALGLDDIQVPAAAGNPPGPSPADEGRGGFRSWAAAPGGEAAPAVSPFAGGVLARAHYEVPDRIVMTVGATTIALSVAAATELGAAVVAALQTAERAMLPAERGTRT